MSGERYRELEHPADLRLEIFGADERELFENAAFALFDRMVDLSGVGAGLEEEVAAEGSDREELLVNLLGELLYRFEGEGRVYREFQVVELGPSRVRLHCRGELFEASRHEAVLEIKAVTHHDVRIRPAPGGLSVVVTCDI